MKRPTLLLTAILLASALSFPFITHAQDDGGLGTPPKRQIQSPPPTPTPNAPATPASPATPAGKPPAQPNSDPAVTDAFHDPYTSATVPPNVSLKKPPLPPNGDPIPPVALNGTWTSDKSSVTINVSGTRVSISGKHSWYGTYDPAAGTLSLTCHPSADDMDKKAPADAKANLQGKFTWYMTLTVRRTPGTFASLQLEGQWYEGDIDWQPRDEKDKRYAAVEHLSWYKEGEPAKPVTYKKTRTI